uniref:Phytosulfokine receptor 1 n=1 Tax=Cajanus cajan TaxID=3821 RepID=A0A151T944_CAJCA|nr:Phytosulfokine receptor 1 [Cajanus cajan]
MGFHSLFLCTILIPFISFGTSTHESQNFTSRSNDLKALNGFSSCLESTILDWNSSTSPDYCTWSGVTCDALPHVGTRVVRLELGSTRLSGKICESLAGLDQLRVLNLSYNFFTASLPENLFHLQNLEVMDFSNNHFEGPVSTAICSSFNRLRVFKLSNNFFSGEIPENLGNCSSLQHLSINGNDLSRSLPESIFQLQNLNELYLQNNKLSGTLSEEVGKLSNLVEFDISNNDFFGFLPNIFGGLTRLKVFNVGSNRFTATLEDLSHCRNLSMLGLSKNFHNEEMPQGQNLEFSNLKVFALGNSQIKGSIPNWLSGCKMLQMLDLSWNHLTGSIPSWIGKFNNLYYLDLSNNSFTGNIPQSFGNLKGLHVMDLKHNSLSGPIPWELSGMTMLEILDLSHNKLSGEIPQSLIELSFLSSFDVSHNELHGEIPTKGQFDTFPTTSFEGNKGLYRHSTSGFMPSPPDETRAQPHHQKLEIIGFPFWFGALAGFLITIAICFASDGHHPTKCHQAN